MGLRRAVKNIFKKIKSARRTHQSSDASHKCYLCEATFSQFLPYRQSVADLDLYLKTLGVVGSDLQNFSCPACYCTDRDRHLCMYFDALGLWAGVANARILHFAPEAAIVPRIERIGPKEYVRGDLFPASIEIEKIDITAIPYRSEHFDIVICNHVLEHVPDDGLALSEIHRVLKPGGYAILQTPYSSVLSSTLSDPGIASDQQRLLLYGQEDHVRLYGNDFFARINESGLRVRRHAHNDLLSNFDAGYYGVNQAEDLIMAERPS